MTDLLIPDAVKNALALASRWGFGLALERRLARAYLALWDRNKELEEYAAHHEDVLRKITKQEGRFSMDHHKHAMNVIEAMAGRAEAALKGEEYDD